MWLIDVFLMSLRRFPRASEWEMFVLCWEICTIFWCRISSYKGFTKVFLFSSCYLCWIQAYVSIVMGSSNPKGVIYFKDVWKKLLADKPFCDRDNINTIIFTVTPLQQVHVANPTYMLTPSTSAIKETNLGTMRSPHP